MHHRLLLPLLAAVLLVALGGAALPPGALTPRLARDPVQVARMDPPPIAAGMPNLTGGFPFRLWSPDEIVRAAAHDLYTVPPESRPYVRYLSLHDRTAGERVTYIRLDNAIVNGTFNTTSQIITPGIVVPDTDNCLIRYQLDLYAYGDSEDEEGKELKRIIKAWDDLLHRGSGPEVSEDPELQLTEPNFYLKVTNAPYLIWGPWLDPTEYTWPDGYVGSSIKALSAESGTFFPIASGSWFLANASIAPAYNDILGLTNAADVDRLAFFVDKVVKRKSVAGLVKKSRVTNHNRLVRYTPTPTGYIFRTFDVKNDLAKRDFYKNPVPDFFDAGEILFTLPNGLQAGALVNNQGKILDFAATTFARDKETEWDRPEVWNYASCIHCHAKGLISVNDQVRLLAGNLPPSKLIPGPLAQFRSTVLIPYDHHREARDFGQLYSVPMSMPVEQGQIIYERAIFLATGGMRPAEFADAFQEAFIEYWQRPLGLEAASLAVGAQPAEVIEILSRSINVDHTLTQILHEDPVLRKQFEADGFHQLAVLVFQMRQRQKGQKP